MGFAGKNGRGSFGCDELSFESGVLMKFTYAGLVVCLPLIGSFPFLFSACSQNNNPTSTSVRTNTPTPTATLTSTLTRNHTPSVTPTPYPTTTWSLLGTLGQYGTDGINADFVAPMGIAAGAGFIAVSDEGRAPENIQVFDSTGNYLYSITPVGGSPDLYGMAIDSYGELY